MDTRVRAGFSVGELPPGSGKPNGDDDIRSLAHCRLQMPMPIRGIDLARSLVRKLPDTRPSLFNPWRSRCRHDLSPDAPRQRLERLGAHLDCSPRLILVGEASGYQGCRYSGMAFTSERLAASGAIPRIRLREERLTDRALPFSEPSATIVWRQLAELGMEGATVLWNALPTHPHLTDQPWTNRTPTPMEFEDGQGALVALLDAFPRARLVAVGRHAGMRLRALTTRPVHEVRHPARGGATLFANGLSEIVGLPGTRK